MSNIALTSREAKLYTLLSAIGSGAKHSRKNRDIAPLVQAGLVDVTYTVDHRYATIKLSVSAQVWLAAIQKITAKS